MLIEAKSFYRMISLPLAGWCLLWSAISLSGCHQARKEYASGSALVSGDVTLLWDEVPNATAYNVYVSKSPGVTKDSGYKFQNVSNPVRINLLEPGTTYYFVVTVVTGSEESRGSREQSYHAVADKIGLVYWKNLFDPSILAREANTAGTSREITTAAKHGGASPENNAPRDQIAGDAAAAGDLAQSSRAETAAIEQELFEETRLKAAKMLAESYFYIVFEENSNELSPRAIEKLDRIFKIMTSNADARLTVNGYSDSSGDPDFNQIISEVRANSVKSYLSGRGIKPSRITVFGHGAKKFLASNKSAEGRRLNRRVEIELMIP
jgi:outer membrane protein OmpA-like peptidoglycan-associated protein